LFDGDTLSRDVPLDFESDRADVDTSSLQPVVLSVEAGHVQSEEARLRMFERILDFASVGL